MSTDVLSKARDPLIGNRIDGRYLVLGVLGRGGMGVVYEGIHEQLGRPVAIKVLAAAISGDPVSVQRFLREAQTASQLTHGNIVDVSDLGVLEDGRPYLVMARIQGTDLATLLEQHGPQTPRRTVELLHGAAAALDLIHAKGFVHRDVKPENLMHVVREDGSETTLLLDFGIVGLVSAQSARLTAEGSVFGTPAYLPPEVIQGALPDRRADVYALATVAFELLSGRPPFEADNPLRILPMKIMNDPPRLSSVCNIPFTREIEDVIDRGLTREPDPRWPSAGEFIAALDAAVLSQEEMMGAAADPRTRTAAKRRPAPGARTQPRGVEVPPLRIPPPRGVIDPAELEAERQLRVSLDSQQLEAVLEKSIAPPPAAPPSPTRRNDATTQMVSQPPSGSGTLSIELEAAVLKPMRTRRHFLGIGIAAGVVIGALALIGHLAFQGDEPEHNPAVGITSQPTAASAKPPAPPPAAEPIPEPVATPEPPVETPPPIAAAEPAPPEAPPPAAAPAPVDKPNTKASKQRASSKAEARASAKAAPVPDEELAPVITVTPAPKPAGKPGVSASELVQAAARELIQGHLNAAADLYSQAARIDPKNESAFRGLGLANERLGRKTEAIRAFNRALTLAPNGQNAAMLRARLAKLQGSP